MLCRALVIVLCLTVPTAGSAQGGSAERPLQGVWKVVESATTGANASTVSNPQPSLIIFTNGHYSFLRVHGAGPRPPFPPAKNPARLTDAEKIARFEQWNPFTANAGTYEVKDEMVILRPIVAKNETVMAKNFSITGEFKLEGNTLWLTTSSPAQPGAEIRLKLQRVE